MFLLSTMRWNGFVLKVKGLRSASLADFDTPSKDLMVAIP